MFYVFYVLLWAKLPELNVMMMMKVYFRNIMMYPQRRSMQRP